MIADQQQLAQRGVGEHSAPLLKMHWKAPTQNARAIDLRMLRGEAAISPCPALQRSSRLHRKTDAISPHRTKTVWLDLLYSLKPCDPHEAAATCAYELITKSAALLVDTRGETEGL